MRSRDEAQVGSKKISSEHGDQATTDSHVPFAHRPTYQKSDENTQPGIAGTKKDTERCFIETLFDDVGKAVSY